MTLDFFSSIQSQEIQVFTPKSQMVGSLIEMLLRSLFKSNKVSKDISNNKKKKKKKLKKFKK